MALLEPLTVSYKGKDDLLMVSPVFDSYTMAVPVPGILNDRVGIALQTFFLVYETATEKKLMWENVENCQIEKRKF